MEFLKNIAKNPKFDREVQVTFEDGKIVKIEDKERELNEDADINKLSLINKNVK